MPENSEFELESTRRKLETANRQIDELRAAMKTLTARAEKAETREKISYEAAKMGLKPGALPDVAFRVSSSEDLKAGLSIKDAIAGLQTSAPHLWPDGPQDAPQLASGGTKAPTKPSGVNPWKTGATWNMTDQARIFREDPDRALRLATEAGKPVVAGGKVGEMPPVPGMPRTIRGY